MEQIVDKIRQTARELLAQGEVEEVWGFARPTVPMGCRPFVARTPEEADKLWWDSFCVMNLANFVPRRSDKKFAVVAQGCVSRNLVVHHLENQLDLDEQVKVLGVPSIGMLDAEAIRRACGTVEISRVEEEGGKVLVAGPGFEKTFSRLEVMRDSCRRCRYHNPVVCDVWVQDKTADEPDKDKDERIREIEALEPQERQALMERIFSPCIRCYACRNACPLCYCETCFVDESKPQWLGKSTEMSDTLSFHFLQRFILGNAVQGLFLNRFNIGKKGGGQQSGFVFKMLEDRPGAYSGLVRNLPQGGLFKTQLLEHPFGNLENQDIRFSFLLCPPSDAWSRPDRTHFRHPFSERIYLVNMFT